MNTYKSGFLMDNPANPKFYALNPDWKNSLTNDQERAALILLVLEDLDAKRVHDTPMFADETKFGHLKQREMMWDDGDWPLTDWFGTLIWGNKKAFISQPFIVDKQGDCFYISRELLQAFAASGSEGCQALRNKQDSEALEAKLEGLSALERLLRLSATAVLKPILETWESQKRLMLADYGNCVMPAGTPTEVPYRRPCISAEMLDEELGLAVFVVEEQIDHQGSDPQMRYKTHLVRLGQEGVTLLYEDHSYTRREGSSLVSVMAITSSHITLSTRKGEQTVALP